MGRRGRRRIASERITRAPDRVTRIRVDDALWAEFRRELDQPISHALGRLVEDEVARRRTERIRHGSASDRDLREALTDARALHADLQLLVRQLERRLDLDADPVPDPFFE